MKLQLILLDDLFYRGTEPTNPGEGNTPTTEPGEDTKPETPSTGENTEETNNNE